MKSGEKFPPAAAFPGSLYGLGGLSRRDRPKQSIDPNLSILPCSAAPGKLVARLLQRVVTQARGGAGSKQNVASAATSGRTCGDKDSKKISLLLWGTEASSDTGVAARQRVGLPPPDGSPRLFLSPPSFFFTHEKERRGAGATLAV